MAVEQLVTLASAGYSAGERVRRRNSVRGKFMGHLRTLGGSLENLELNSLLDVVKSTLPDYLP